MKKPERNLQFYTASIRTPRVAGIMWVDISIKGGSPKGKVFAPTWEMILEYKNKLTDQDLREAVYREKYHKLMLNSYYKNFEIWEEFLNMQIPVAFYCYCASGTFCHRYLLTNYLYQLGAKYLGEK